VQKIYARIKGSEEKKNAPGFFTFPCSSKIPPISITLGDNELFMDPETVKISAGLGTCTGSIVYEETFGDAVWVLGDSWMANFYTIFDYGKKQIGFAPATPVA
jgi:cathepsin D